MTVNSVLKEAPLSLKPQLPALRQRCLFLLADPDLKLRQVSPSLAYCFLLNDNCYLIVGIDIFGATVP